MWMDLGDDVVNLKMTKSDNISVQRILHLTITTLTAIYIKFCTYLDCPYQL